MNATEIRHACTRALCSLGLAIAALPAQADLKLEDQHLAAWVQLIEPGQSASGPTTATWAMGTPPGPMTVVGAARGDSLAAAARQTPDGFFHAAVTLDQTWADRPGTHTVGAGTTFESLITTNQHDTPLVLDFLFLGSRLEAGTYYGSGDMVASTRLTIRAGIGNSTTPGLTPYWGFEDQLLLDARGNFVPQSTSTIDRNGIGLPSTHADHGWRDMVVFGQLNRDAFAATLDFGLLQPGEYFALHYSTEVRIVSDNPYASTARAEVIDPFSLRDPPVQVTLRGLVLPAPVGVVPEPGTPLLLLAGLLGLAALTGRPAAVKAKPWR